jgi:hypothetical protein
MEPSSFEQSERLPGLDGVGSDMADGIALVARVKPQYVEVSIGRSERNLIRSGGMKHNGVDRVKR